MSEESTETLKSKAPREKVKTILGVAWLCGFFAIASTGLNWLLALWTVVAWLLSCLQSARESGWAEIAHLYPAQRYFRGQWKHFQGGRFNQQTVFGNLLNVGANSNGIRLSIILPFRVAHPPIFIPWEDISGEKSYHSTGYMSPGWIFPTWTSQTKPIITLHFAKIPSIDIEISRELGAFFEIASDGKWKCN
ncbi:MAG: hypothetical protein ACK2UQ_15245 [Anaerolineae bacterium]